MINKTKTNKELKETINFYDEEVNKIRNQVTSGDISVYKVFLLIKKLNLISYKLTEIVEDVKNNRKKIKFLKLYLKYEVFLPLLLGFIIPNLWIGLFVLIIKLCLDLKIEVCMDGLKKDNDELSVIIKDINEKMKNTNDILVCKIEDINFKISMINDCNLNYVENAYLLNLLDNKANVNEVPINIKNDISKILQQDLDLSSSTFEELIDIAKESLKDEVLKRELRLKN